MQRLIVLDKPSSLKARERLTKSQKKIEKSVKKVWIIKKVFLPLKYQTERLNLVKKSLKK